MPFLRVVQISVRLTAVLLPECLGEVPGALRRQGTVLV